MAYCGQQQPESDHNVAYNDSDIGYLYDCHWRKADDWFSYSLRNKDRKARFLLVTHIDTGEKGQASISANGKIVKNIGSGNLKGETYSTLISLTEDISGEQIEVTIKATREGIPTPHFSEIRLLSNSIIEE